MRRIKKSPAGQGEAGGAGNGDLGRSRHSVLITPGEGEIYVTDVASVTGYMNIPDMDGS